MFAYMHIYGYVFKISNMTKDPLSIQNSALRTENHSKKALRVHVSFVLQ